MGRLSLYFSLSNSELELYYTYNYEINDSIKPINQVQTLHFFLGFILDPRGHRKTELKDSEFIINPSTLIIKLINGLLIT